MSFPKQSTKKRLRKLVTKLLYLSWSCLTAGNKQDSFSFSLINVHSSSSVLRDTFELAHAHR